jgi:beta-lactamase superfamily II metal-dependent hydrolase
MGVKFIVWAQEMIRLLTTAILALITAGPILRSSQDVRPPASPGELLPAWTAGTLDIHQIATGRGNSAFVRFPDGTTLLIDAGDGGETPNAEPRPDGSKSPGKWIASYVRQMAAGTAPALDYAVVTHIHPDHMGGLRDLSGDIPIGRLIDRGWPDYAYMPPPADELFKGYRALTSSLGAAKMMRAEAGSAAQIVPVRDQRTAGAFTVRIIAVNDRVWTGSASESKVRFPALATIAAAEDRPTENMCSVALRISYGPFDFFTGGDMPGYPVPGGPAWHDLETDVAKAIGPTDVHVVNHHGSIEEENLFWLATLRSRVLIVPAWQATHPSPDVLKRMLSKRVYPQPRDVFVTVFRDATKAAIGARANQVASDHGHVVVRVEPGGGRYWVIVLDDTTEARRVRSVHGPYAAE